MQLKKRNGAVDFWKFIFSVVIVLFHTFHYSSIHGIQPFIGGNSSVEFFFLVSGFLMAQSADRVRPAKQGINLGIETRSFMLRKIKGLYPEFAVAWIIAFAVMHIAKGSLAVGTIVKDALTGTWELFLLRMSGLAGYRANVVTWYISAMVLAMLVLYPLILKYRETFINIIAPCTAVFLLGYMFQAYGNLGGGTEWEGFFYKGLMRAFADLSLGCILWEICQKIKRYRYTTAARILFSAVEFGGYLFCLVWMFGHGSSKMSFVLLMILSICVTITFSHAGIAAELFDNRLCYALGRFSYSLYISQICWIKTVDIFFASFSKAQRLAILAGLITATAAFVQLTSDLIRKKMPAVRLWLSERMICPEEETK